MNVLHISNLHFDPRHWEGNDKILLKKLNSFEADIIINTGDNTTDRLEDEYAKSEQITRKKGGHIMGFAPTKMQLRSDAFEPDTEIPSRFTGEGKDVSPALSWEKPPEGTKTFAVICHDPDAPLVSSRGTYGFVHWVLYNIPEDMTHLDEGTNLYTAGINDFGQTGYNGPMPPNGHGQHNYYFWILALDTSVALEPGLNLWGLLEKAEPYLIGMNRLIGRYKRD